MTPGRSPHLTILAQLADAVVRTHVWGLAGVD
jgi:hypothetical protein